MSFGFSFSLPAYQLRGLRSGGGNNPFNQSGPTLDLSFVDGATNVGDQLGADTYTLDTNFITPQYQVAAQYAVWENGVGLAQKTFSQIVTFSRTSGATWFNSAGVNVGIDFSTTSNTIGTGSKTFTLIATAGIDRSWTAGDSVLISDQSNSSNNMVGTVTSYTASTQVLVVNVTSTGGSGTIASWRIGSTMPRFDYNPATLAARGLLIEEPRTNLMLQSQFVSGWTATAGTLTANVVASPNGTTDAASYIEDSTTAVRNVNQSSQSFTAGATLTASMFVKQTGGATRHFRIQVSSNTGTNGFRAYFNLSTNSVALQTTGFGTGTAVANSATITPVGNGWYRISASGTVDPAATTASGMGFMQDTPSGGASYTGDGTSGLFLWGAQLETGSFPTSYIPTTTTALTRSEDKASVNTLAPWYNATEGTLFAQASLISSSYTSGVLIDVGAGGAFGTTEYMNWTGSVWALGPNTAPLNVTSSVTTTSTAKVAAGIKVNDSVISANGLIGLTDTSCSIASAPTTLSIGKAGWSGGANYFNGWIQRITYYPRRLANADLQTITT